MSKTPESKGNKQKVKTDSFFRFMLLKEQRNQFLIFSLLFFILYILLIKIVPFPPSISDSGGYVNSALSNRIDTYRPFGYSQFLISIHKWSTSIHFLVFVQYFLNALCTLALIFSIKYFFRPKNSILFYLFALLAIFSPLTLYLTNTVLSDSLFTSLTILWVTSGLWMLYDQKIAYKIIFYIINLIFLFLLISVRYTGLVYIGITAPLILYVFYKRNIYVSIILALVPIIFLFGYYKTQKAKVYDLVKVNTFSGFSGWQLANNALNCVSHIKIEPNRIENFQVREFAEGVVMYDTLLILKEEPSAKFMWDKNMPLKAYCYYQCDKTRTPYVYQWNYLGEYVYSKFGKYIITHYPIAFAKHYLLPNFYTTLYPKHDQIIKRYRTDGIPSDLVKDWFKLDPSKYSNSKSTLFEKNFSLFPISRLLIWILVFVSFALYVVKRKRIVWDSFQQYMLWTLIAFLAIYTAFNVYASPFELRYIAPVHLVQITILYVLANSVNTEFISKIIRKRTT